MDLLLILTYTALCVAVFKIFRIPLNKWTVPTAALGGVILIGALVLLLVLFLVCSGVVAMSAIEPRPPGSAVVQAKPSTVSAAGDLNLPCHDPPCRLGNNTFPFPRGRDILPTSSLHPFTFGPEPEA